MAFHFSLEGLLRLRAALEQVEERALLRLRLEERLLEQEIEQMAAVRMRQRSRRVAAVSGGSLTGADLRFAGFLEARLALEEEKMQQRLREKREDTQRQVTVFSSARRRREAIEALRDRERTASREAERRREQRGLDDLFLLQLLRKRARLPRG
jgi:flagellar export protein FliJ